MEERASDLGDRNIEIIQLEEERELRFLKHEETLRAIRFNRKGKYKNKCCTRR